MNISCRTLLAIVPAIVFCACAGSPKPTAELERMTDAQLLDEACSDAARSPLCFVYDADYHARVAEVLFSRRSWSEAEKTAILSHRISQGMTEEQVLLSWGRPDDRTDMVTGNLSITHLTYWRGTYEHWQDVTLQNGRVTGWMSR